MSKLTEVERLLKIIERKVKDKKDDFRTILFTTKDEDGKKYDYFDWSEKGQFNEIDKSRYENKEGITVFVNMGFGYVPPNRRREDYG